MRPGRNASARAAGEVLAAGRFDDLRSGSGWLFGEATRVVLAREVGDVLAVFDAVELACAGGQWAYGYVGYEAAPALNPDLAVVASASPAAPPLAWFAICGPPEQVEAVQAPTAVRDVGRWNPMWRSERYDQQVRHLQAMIAAGQTYQGNLTVALESELAGDFAEFYAQLAHRQRGSYSAYLDIGTHVIASASPELFYDRSGDLVRMRPMKGTAARGRTVAEDALILSRLRGSPKERAENVMILDLLRNDLGRIAETGSVRVSRVCEPERYETVWQLVSEVSATVPPGTSTLDLFRAVFPSGSVTGAPKVATMRILAELEDEPRGPYCGAIGFVGPSDASGDGQRTERFNVAIRTVVIDKSSGSARYGTGGAITWGSTTADEHAELLVKAQILNAPHEDFELFETMAHLGGAGLRNLDRHLARLACSAEYFGFIFDAARLRVDLDAAVVDVGDVRVRLSLRRDGTTTLLVGPLPRVDDSPVRLAIDEVAIDSGQPWFFHKTSRRGAYLERSARHPEAADVVLVNERGQVTETTIANIAVRVGQRWFTPPVESGCLPGVGRAALVEAGELIECPFTVGELRRADELAVVSSLRGWRSAALLEP